MLCENSSWRGTVVVQAIKNLYLDSANLIWNGQSISGKDAIIKFLEDLPTSKTTLSSLDSQPVNGKATGRTGNASFLDSIKNWVKGMNKWCRSIYLAMVKILMLEGFFFFLQLLSKQDQAWFDNLYCTLLVFVIAHSTTVVGGQKVNLKLVTIVTYMYSWLVLFWVSCKNGKHH